MTGGNHHGLKYEPQVRRFVHAHSFSTREDREDFEQDARLAIWEGGISSASGAYTVLRRLYWRLIQVEQAEPSMSDFVPDRADLVPPSPEVAAMHAEALDQLARNPIEARVVELIFVMGYSQTEVADLLEVDRLVIQRAVDRLRERIEA